MDSGGVVHCLKATLNRTSCLIKPLHISGFITKISQQEAPYNMYGCLEDQYSPKVLPILSIIEALQSQFGNDSSITSQAGPQHLNSLSPHPALGAPFSISLTWYLQENQLSGNPWQRHTAGPEPISTKCRRVPGCGREGGDSNLDASVGRTGLTAVGGVPQAPAGDSQTLPDPATSAQDPKAR